MFEKDRAFVLTEVLRVLADWGVPPTGRGTGEGDAEYWVDEIIGHNGWEPYWEDTRMPREFLANGHTKGHPAPAPVPVGDPYMVKLNAIHADLQMLLTGLRRYF